MHGLQEKWVRSHRVGNNTWQGLDMQNLCAEIKLRAERKAGELLKEQDIKPGNPQLSHDTIIEKPKLSDLGIKPDQSSRWQKIADILEETFEKHIVETKEKKKEQETKILRLYLKCWTQKQIAEELEWSIGAVNKVISKIPELEKMKTPLESGW